MNTKLKESIENLYRSFKDVPMPKNIEGCPCCVDKKEIGVLHKKSLRELTPDDLSGYASSVLKTVGSVEDFLYFLPRILEILVTDDGWWPDAEVVAGALELANFEQWPSHHKEAVLNYFNAVFEDILETDDTGLEIDTWICTFGRALTDVKPYLEQLSQYPDKVREFYFVNREELVKSKLSNPSWDESMLTKNQVLDWFNSPEIKQIYTN